MLVPKKKFFKKIRNLVFIGVFLIVILLSIKTILPFPLFKAPYSYALLSREDNLLSAKLAEDGQWRFPLNKKVPEKFKEAIINFEDRYFYFHLGVNPFSILRALYLNIKFKKIVSGGSTISMQVIRLFRRKPRTYFEKFIEIILTLSLELNYSKDEILRQYSEQAPFGGNIVGVEAATWRLFGANMEKLTWAQACLLAVLPNNPSALHINKNRHLLLRKRNFLLKKLLRRKRISKLEYKLALLEPLPNRLNKFPGIAPHFFHSHISKNPNKYIIRSTLNQDLQKKSESIALKSSFQLANQEIHNLSLLVVENKTLSILSYVGNVPNNSASMGAFVDVIPRNRSSGSTLKPLLYAAMLDDGLILPDSLIFDVPSFYKNYSPLNYNRNYKGVVTAKEALIESLNVPAVRMLNLYGVPKFYALLNNLGFQSFVRSAEEYGLSLILGGGEVSLLDLVTVYSNLARSLDLKNTNVLELKSVVEQNQNEIGKIDLSKSSLWLTFEALKDLKRPIENQSFREFLGSKEVAWKTGTSHGLKDAWAVGVTSKYTVGVWVGNTNGEGRHGLTGLSAAAPILFKVFRLLPKSPWFTEPVSDLKEIQVCIESGYLLNAGCKSKVVKIPKFSHFKRVSPFHRRVYLDLNRQFQVHKSCESSENIIAETRFILPPIAEKYYVSHNLTYSPLPPFRADCLPIHQEKPIDISYPSHKQEIYFPVTFENERGKVIATAVHRFPEKQVFWHLDGNFLGSTEFFHSFEFFVEKGNHRLTLIDEDGYEAIRLFTVIDK